MPIAIFLSVSPTASAVSFDVQGMRLGINGYIDLEYTYMGKMPIEDTGTFRAIDEQSYNDLFKVRAGSFLMPFGIYNEVHYIAYLFATVVLPQMYHPFEVTELPT